MTSLRIALVHPFAWPDVRRGGERYLDDLGRYLSGSGHDVEMITGTAGKSSTVDLGDGPGRLRLRRLHHPQSNRLERRGVRTVETFGLVALPHLARRRYDVVHALTPTAALAARASLQTTVYTLLGLPRPGLLRTQPVQRRLAHAAVRSATEVAALSAAAAAGCAAAFGRQVVVLPPGVQLDLFTPDLAARSAPPRVLLSADASDRRKGLDLLLAAFPRVLAVRPDARLQISSAGDWRWALDTIPVGREELLAAIDDLGAGRPDEVAARYRGASVTVLPSQGEAFGMVLVESLASGTPVVCNDDGGMPDIVSDRSIGRVVDAADPAALADAILAAVELSEVPGTAARCTAHAKQWDWQTAVGPAHEELYQRLARRRASSRFT